jgi:signal transduction histidine kinase
MGDSNPPSADFERRLEQAKLAALVEFAYGAGHEINNPLANIAARAQSLLADEPDPERRRKLSAIHRQAMRAHEMIADLMLFARPPKLEIAAADLRRILLQVVDDARELATERSINLAADVGTVPIPVRVDATQLAVAVMALVVNAIEAIGSDGRVIVAARPLNAAADCAAEVVVRDNGPGISDDMRPHLFDPFFSGREAGRGLGFGLSKCWRIVTDHGGQVFVDNVAGGGAEFTIALPQSLGC